MISICILHALKAGHYTNFDPINGTFQNFNPVRRLLSGQIPYDSFQDYLGLGHLYIGTLATLLFGGDYQASLIGFSFLTFFSLALISLMVGYAIFKNRKNVLAITNIFLIMLLVQPLFFTNALLGTNEISAAVHYALGTGISARFVRGMILPISCWIFYVACLAYTKIKTKKENIARHRYAIQVCGTGFIAGFCFIWSNDYGISCWLCICIMMFFLMLSRTRKIGKSFLTALLTMLVSFVSIFLLVEIFTFGTGGYQLWYFNFKKSYYLYDVDFSFIMLIQAFLCLIYLANLFRCRGTKNSLIRYGILAFLNMTSFCAVNEYCMISGGTSREVALTVLFFTIIYEIFYVIKLYIPSYNRVQKIMLVISAVVSLSWTISTFKEEAIFYKFSIKKGEYMAALGGNMTTRYKALKETDKFLKDENYFATYATAQEVVSGIFQPSGTDYIIHVLGDQQRQDYLNEFTEGDFKYAATIKKSYEPWEYWIERANWFFYRELYRGWHPVYANSYEVYWERNTSKDTNVIANDCNINVVDIDDSTKKIIIQADSEINGIADVYIDYEVKKRDRLLAKLLFRTDLKVKNTGTVFCSDKALESNFLRDASKEYVPVPVVDGYGEITLTANPTESATLLLNNAECSDIYLTPRGSYFYHG